MIDVTKDIDVKHAGISTENKLYFNFIFLDYFVQ
jgi:hypothetical protein